MLSKDIDECVTDLLKELVRFQDRLYQKDPMKARMKRRLVMGLREVLKHLKLRKVKCIIISPNCERIESRGTVSRSHPKKLSANDSTVMVIWENVTAHRWPGRGSAHHH